MTAASFIIQFAQPVSNQNGTGWLGHRRLDYWWTCGEQRHTDSHTVCVGKSSTLTNRVPRCRTTTALVLGFKPVTKLAGGRKSSWHGVTLVIWAEWHTLTITIQCARTCNIPTALYSPAAFICCNCHHLQGLQSHVSKLPTSSRLSLINHLGLSREPTTAS